MVCGTPCIAPPYRIGKRTLRGAALPDAGPGMLRSIVFSVALFVARHQHEREPLEECGVLSGEGAQAVDGFLGELLRQFAAAVEPHE